MPNGPANSLEDLLVDPYLVQTGYFERHEHPTEGAVVTLRIPVQFSDSPGRVRRLPPRLGEHTEEVLSEIRLPRADASSLKRTPQRALSRSPSWKAASCPSCSAT